MQKEPSKAPTLAALLSLEADSPFDPAAVLPGELDARVLEQDEVWVDRSGRVLLLTEMSDEHRLGVLRMAHAQAPRWRLWAGLEALVQAPLAVIEPAQATGVDLLPPTALEWLEEQPLIRRLRELSPDMPPPEDLRPPRPERAATRGTTLRAAGLSAGPTLPTSRVQSIGGSASDEGEDRPDRR